MTSLNPFRKQVLALLGEHLSEKSLVLCPTSFVRLLHGDHKAAILLSQILYWSDRTKDQDGWFYKSYSDWQQETGLSETQVRRILNGDRRAKTQGLTLRHFGVETKLRKVRHTGAPTLHYRINQPQFLAALDAFLEPGDPMHCTGSIPDSDGGEPPAVPAINADQRGGSLIPSETSSSDQQAEDHDPSDDNDLKFFLVYEKRFGKLKTSQQSAFHAELERLGRDQIGRVLERCATRGRSWTYVLKALTNEAASAAEGALDSTGGVFTSAEDNLVSNPPQVPAAHPLPRSEHLQQPWLASGATAQQLWEHALVQLEAQLDRENFLRFVRDLVLVDVDLECSRLSLAVTTPEKQAILQHRLQRTIARILRDVAGAPLAVDYVLSEMWQHTFEQRQIASRQAEVA
jgi:hypothetical protein